MTNEIHWAALAAPFPENEVEFRIQSSGKGQKGVWAKCLCYMNNRAVMNRLDAVVGPANWANRFEALAGGGIVCGISIRVGAEWVTKWDGADQTDIEAVKGGLSGAMKRAAVQWGIGRYLYELDETWAEITDNRDDLYARLPKEKGGDEFHWRPPPLPDWALPGGAGKRPTAEPQDDAATFGAAMDAEAAKAKKDPKPPKPEFPGTPEEERIFEGLCDRIEVATSKQDVEEAFESAKVLLPSKELRARLHKWAGVVAARRKRDAAHAPAEAGAPEPGAEG